MTLEEAMTDLSIQREVKRRLGKDHEAEAIALGIEALKNYKEMKDMGEIFHAFMLPGETEEHTTQRHGKDIRGDYFYEQAQK